MARSYLLVHGAWHTAATWDGVIAALTTRGHHAVAATLPGHTPAAVDQPVSYDDYIHAIIRTAAAIDGMITVVGHSSAGHLLQAAMPGFAARIEHVIFHNAFLLDDGDSQFDRIPAEVRTKFEAIGEAQADKRIPPDIDFVRHVLMAGDTREHQEQVFAKLVPQPIALFQERVATTAFSEVAAPRSAVFAEDDTTLAPGIYLEMAARFGVRDVVTIAGGHETLIINPERVADAIILAGDRLAAPDAVSE